GPDNAFDDDVDEQPVQDLALNVDNVFQAEDCDAFDSDVDEAPTAQTMFMANLSSADPITDEAEPSYDSDILSEVQDHDQYPDDTCAYQEEHVMHDSVQLDHVVDLHADYTSVSNMILYDQYVKDNEVPVVHSNASSVQNDTFMMIYNDMREPSTPSVSNSSRNAVVKNSLTTELATYREQVELGLHQQRSLTRNGVLNIPRHVTSMRSFHSLKPSKTILRAFKALTKEVKEMKNVFKELEAEVAQVTSYPKANESQPKSNPKTNRISPAKGANKLPVEDLLRTNKSHLRTTNRVDSSSRIKRTCPLTRFTPPQVVSATQNKNRPVVQIVLWYLDSGCSKDITRDRSRLLNFIKKFIGIVRFGNDHFGAIMGYGDYVVGESVISRVYYAEGLGHNLFSVEQFCYSDLEVAFRKHSCYVRDTDGVDLIKGSRGSNLYTISVEDMMKSSPICLLSKASKNKSWLWHWRLNHLNFGNINDLARKDLVRGLPRLKFKKGHFCLACQLGKSKKHTHKLKAENTNLEVLNTLYMDLCGLMRVQTINGKKYILVIMDDYSRFTWVKFLRSKDETLNVVIKFITQIQVVLNKTVRYVRTNNGIEF
nr:integrase, catalytic region, zinc finger, CCHC-type, peptidase aspartic, catalytic [Tanacetum cinerariifolium]